MIRVTMDHGADWTKKYVRMLEEAGGETEPVDAVIFFAFSLVVGIACRHLFRGTRVPYTVALLIVGCALGSLEYGTSHRLGKLGDGIRQWANIDTELFLVVFLPALLFESSLSLEMHQIKRCAVQIFLLAGPGVLISTFCLGSALKFTFPYNWDWKTSLLFGGILSATDTVAVISLLKDLGASKKLSTIIEGESLLNDGAAIVVYQLFFRMAMGFSYDWSSIIKFVLKVSFGAVGIGLAFGITSALWLGYIFNDTVIEICLTLAVSYVAFFTAQSCAGVSGVLTVMTLGMFYAAFARTAFKGNSQQSLHHFWEMVAYIANTLIFVLSGVEIAAGVIGSNGAFTRGSSWGLLFLLYLFVQLSRAFVVGLFYPILRSYGYGINWREAIVVIWSGLRGAVALSLALSVQQSNEKLINISPEAARLFVFFTGGVVFLTLIINGSTTQFVLHALRLDRLSGTKKRILDYTKYEMLNKALESYEDLEDDDELGSADWPTVKSFIRSLDKLEEEERTHPHSKSCGTLDLTNMKDIRIRLLNGVQAAYWGMLDEGRIAQHTATILMQSVDEAIDRASSEALCDWKGLKSRVHFPNHYKFLQANIFHQKLVTFFIVQRLQSACHICAAFLRAHKIAREQLDDFLGGSAIASAVIKESEAEGDEAKKYLENVRATFPQVLQAVKTRQVTYTILNQLIDYVQNLEKVGLLEEKEMVHLEDAVQTDLKKLLMSPALLKLPKINDMIAIHPLFETLPPDVSRMLKDSSKETMKMCDMTLYKEGSRSSGVWLIGNGIVKWASKSIETKFPSNQKFMHGTTLGLYEVLSGRPYICDVSMDSVGLCRFIEADKVLSILQSDPGVEDMLWKESAIILVKLLLPPVFEKMNMHNMRELVSDSSIVRTYIAGETIEVPQNSVGLLLEGFAKNHCWQEELLASPALLLPTSQQGFRSEEGNGCVSTDIGQQAAYFTAETRARVIVLYIAAFEAGKAFMKRPSFKPHPLEHDGLMSWPDYYQKPNQRRNSGVARATNNLSSRVAQLMADGGRRSESFKTETLRGRSLSYPNVPCSTNNALVSVKSEGSTTLRRKIGETDISEDNSSRRAQSVNANGRRAANEDSSDESEAEKDDELVIRIDSPSRLSFRHSN